MIHNLEIPRSVVLPLNQHLGAPARPVVNKGDVVKTGQLIARGDGLFPPISMLPYRKVNK
jgi:electron transport complex protein RnfC